MPSTTSTTQTGNPGKQSQEIEQQTKVLVNMLFARFKAIYTHKFDSAYSSLDEIKLAKREWAVALKGFKEPLLAYAVERCKEQHSWPPTIADFLKLVHTAYKAYGLPDPRSAYLEACACRCNPLEFRWSHPAVYFAGANVSWYTLRGEEEARVWPAFERAYIEQVEKVMAGDVLRIPKVVALENKTEDGLEATLASLVGQTGLPEAEVASLLYYLKKTKGTAIRQRYRQMSLQKFKDRGHNVELPE